MAFSFIAVEAKTGKIIADLPLLDLPTAKVTIGRYESVSATLPVATAYAPVDWVRATKPNGAHIVLLADNPKDPAHGIPLVMWRINRRTRDESDTIKLDLMTIESYFDRIYIKGKTYTATGQNSIITDLITSYIGSAVGGIPIRVQVVTAGVGTLRDRTYLDADDKTVYSAMTDLSGVIGGPEWTVGVEWQTAPERLTPVLYVGDRVGAPVTPGLSPAATFEMPGSVTSFQMIEDFGTGSGATDVMTTSSGQGTTRPQSSHQILTDPDMPNIEYRYSPSTSITEVSTLNSHAQKAITQMIDGATALALSGVAAEGPRLGIDWVAGDDAGYVVGGMDANGNDTVPAFPGGIKGVARVGGWELTLSDTPVVTPILISSTGAF